MRRLLIVLALANASPAAAQPYLALTHERDAEWAQAAKAARGRDVTLTNELAVLQARAQADQALSNLAATRAPILPPPPRDSDAPLPKIDVSKLVQIPDAALAASNARAVAASENRR